MVATGLSKQNDTFTNVIRCVSICQYILRTLSSIIRRHHRAPPRQRDRRPCAGGAVTDRLPLKLWNFFATTGPAPVERSLIGYSLAVRALLGQAQRSRIAEDIELRS